MTLIVDSAPLVALADRRDPNKASVQAILELEIGPIVMSMAVAAEVDHLLRRRAGPGPRRAFLRDIAAGRFRVECLADDDWGQVAELEARYADLAPGLADLSLVLLASRHGTTRILTFDHRDFRVLRPLSGAPAFELLPSEATLS